MLNLRQLLMKQLFILLTFLISFNGWSQTTIGANFEAFLPTGELKKDASEMWGGGVGFEGVFSIKQSPFHVGFITSFTHMGSEVREGFHGPDLGDVRVRRNFEMIKALGLFRFKPDCGENIFPYFDLMLGGGNVYTRTSIRESFIDEPLESYFDMDTWTFTYGFGFGNEFFLSDYVILDVFFRTIKTNRIEFLTPKSVTFNSSNNWYDFEVKSAAFNHINVGFGIKFLFNELFGDALPSLNSL